MRDSGAGKWICAICAVVVSVSAGFVLSIGTFQKITAALVGLIAALLVMSIQVRNHFLGLALLVVTAVAVPYEFGGTGKMALNSSPFLAGTICAIWLVEVVVLHRAVALKMGRPVLAAMALMGSVAVSFVAAQFPLFPSAGAPRGAQLAQVLIFLVSIGLFLIVGDLLKDIADLKRLTWLFLAAGGFVCVMHIVPTRVFPMLLGRLVHVAHQESIGSVFWIWLVAISASQAIFNRELTPMTRLAIGALTGLAVYRGLFLARSWVSGWLPPLVALFVLLLFRVPRLAIITALLGGLLFLYFTPTMTEVTPAEEHYSAMTRLEAARVLWPLIKESPFLGMGPANYHYYVSMSPILGWYVRFNSHNQYLDLVAQLGAVGVATFGWLMCEILAAIWHLRVRFRGGFCEAYLLGALGGFAGTMLAGGLADWILPFYYNIGLGGMRSSLLFWVFLGAIAVIRRAAHTEALPAAPAVAGTTFAARFAAAKAEIAAGRRNRPERF